MSVEFDRKDIDMNKLVATTLESKFYIYDMRTQHETKGFSSLVEKVSIRAVGRIVTILFDYSMFE